MSQVNIFQGSTRQSREPAQLAPLNVEPLNVRPISIPSDSNPVASNPPTRAAGLWEALFSNLNYNFDAVYTVIDAILTAKDRCQTTSLYIQAIVTRQATFLASNLEDISRMRLTAVDRCWRLGRAHDCELRVLHPAIDSCHAAIAYDPATGFVLTDLGSPTGIYHNRHRLPHLSKRSLRDGDLLEFGTLRMEFFVDDFATVSVSGSHSGNATYF
ncbi:MAG: FHA domain-containing protein [Cyanobacteria bacterium J06628_6]